MRPNKSSCKLNLTLNYQILTTPEKVANAFNDYFASVANLSDDFIRSTASSPLQHTNRTSNSFVFFEITASEVKRTILSFKTKKSPLDEILSYAFKFVAYTFSSHLAKFFNESVSKGKFPSCLKTARVITIFKSGSKLEVKNYQPISTLDFFGKLFE